MSDALDSLMRGLTTPAMAASKLGIDPEQAIPPMTDLALPMFDYQREAVEHVFRDTVNTPYTYVGLDMGLGKTPVGLATAAGSIAAGHTPFLIVVPPSLRINWVREARKFTPWLSVATLTGKDETTGKWMRDFGTYEEHGTIADDGMPEVDLLIMGDSSVSGWHEYLSDRVAGLVVDEAHRFKNANSGRSKALVALAEAVPGLRVLMSGTPMPNGRHQELAKQVDVMGKGAWRDIGGIGKFWSYYNPKVDQYARESAHGVELHQAMSNTWFHRRVRGDVLDLPNKGRTSVMLEGKGAAVNKYNRAEDNLIAFLAGEQDGYVTAGQRRAEALIRMTTLRKLAGEAKVRSTVEHVKEILENEPGGVFVVAEHKDVINKLEQGLLKYNPAIIKGGMTDQAKADNQDAFTEGVSRVMIGQVIAAGVGLTFHGGGRNHRVVVAQLPWTPADLRQAEDRLHRIGQTHDVMVEVALCAIEGRWTIDERLWGLLEGKHFMSSTVVDGEGEYLIESIQEGVLDTYR
jgi:hypothetical protein